MSICSRIFATCSLVLLTSAGAFGASVFPGVVRTSAGKTDFTIELTPKNTLRLKRSHVLYFMLPEMIDALVAEKEVPDGDGRNVSIIWKDKP